MDDVTTVRGLSEKQAMERVIQFAQRFGPLHGDLAAHAAFPLVLTPDLLYRMWASFLPQIPWTTVSDILLSPLCREVGYELYEMDPAIRNILLAELREDSRFGESRLRELAQFLRDYIRADLQADDPDQRELADAQRITALAHTEPDEAAREIALKISDPSQLEGADLLRVATLTETLSQPLREYSPLIAYARGVERLAHGDQQAASNLFNRVFEEKQDIKIGDVTLSRPRRAPEPSPPVTEQTSTPGAPNIFISYRRTDSEYVVGRIRDRLTTAFGEGSTYRDLVDIPVGANFGNFIEEAISTCDVMLVMIGPRWADITDARGNKWLFDPDNFTRIEIETGLARKETLLIPVLVLNATMPRPEDLPESLRGLLRRKAITLRNDPDFEADTQRLVQEIRRSVKEPSIPIQYFEPETVLIPAGTFQMGSFPRKEVTSYETPQHEVDLPAYRIGKYPVTNAQYREFIHETGKAVAPPGWGTQGIPEGSENRPVMRVTWYEALEYCQWLSQKTGRHYTLPNEAQWEKACRGGGNSLYPWGDTFDSMRCNANPTSITPVDRYPPQNDFGGFDFVGNVRQWTCTLWGENRDAPDPRYSYPWRDDGRNDLNASRQVRRVLRGSSYSDGTRLAYCSFRSGQVPDERGVAGAGFGFRVVMLDPVPSEFSGNIQTGEEVAGTINIGSSFDNAPQTSTSPNIGILTRQISLERGVNVRAANIAEDRQIPQALVELEIPHPNSVIVLVGGADEIGVWDKFPMRKAIRIITKLAEETGSVVVDGGLQAGIMKELGDQRKRNNFSFTLLGVVSDSLLMQQEPGSLLDPNHSCFFLIPGEDRGDESAWISKIATVIAGEQKSITVLINGSDISQSDVEYGLLEDRPAYVMRGTGGLADEITLTGKVFAVDISEKPDEILEFLKARLIPSGSIKANPQDPEAENREVTGEVIAGGNVNVVQTDTPPGVRRRAARPEPPRSPRLFIGRDEELARLERSILNREAIVITGPQGIGKSTLLRQAANGEAARAMPDGVLWIDNVDEQGRPLGLDDIIQKLFDALYQSDPPLQVSLETTRPYFSEIEMLIILDGLELSSDAFNALANLFTRSVVVLSSTTVFTGSDFKTLHLGALPAGDAIQLFMELAGPSYENADISLIDSICRLLGYVPLGIVMTTQILQEESTSLELIREILAASLPQSRDESAAGLERAYELVGTLSTAPAAERPLPLPDELTSAIEHSFPEVRLNAVQQLSKLLTGKHLGLARSAREALERLAEDDSRRVSQAATQALEAIQRGRQTEQGSGFAEAPADIANRPITQTMITYVLGDDSHDKSFNIDTSDGEFLGEYGVGTSETIGDEYPMKAAAFEIWLFDKNDIKTVTKVLATEYAYNDPNLRARLELKGELVVLKPEEQILLETATLQLRATVVDIEYAAGAQPPRSYFGRITLKLAVWPRTAQ